MPASRYATAMIVCSWADGGMQERRVSGDALTAEAVSEAIAHLNGDLYLQGDGEAHMAVAGGPEHFVVYATRDNEEFHTLARPGEDPDRIIEIVAGGQLGDFPATIVVDRDSALRACLYWMRLGEPDPRLEWERT